MSQKDAVLSYHDVLVHQSDLNLLQGPHWLNDTIISFYFEYLGREVYDTPDLLFISPEVTQCLKMVDGKEFPVFLDPLDFKSRMFVFFAVNDNQLVRTGGSHWSLLIYSKQENAFFHCDSLNGYNEHEALILSEKLKLYLDSGDEFYSLKPSQQSNGYDCGIHVLCNADILAKHALKTGCMKYDYPIVSLLKIKRKRSDLYKLIRDLSDQ